MIKVWLELHLDFSGGSVVKNPPANAGYMDSIPGSEWEKEMATIRGVTKELDSA